VKTCLDALRVCIDVLKLALLLIVVWFAYTAATALTDRDTWEEAKARQAGGPMKGDAVAGEVEP
jgi:hypothetical protein